MSEEYNAYEFAKSLGFSDDDCQRIANAKDGKGLDATNIRRIAKVKGLLPDKPKIAAPPLESVTVMFPPEPEERVEIDVPKFVSESGAIETEPKGDVIGVGTKAIVDNLPKRHKHYYRKDGSCSCGAVRKANKATTKTS